MSERKDIQDLKRELATHLCDENNLKQPEGIATGSTELNRFLLWGGFPKGALSLLAGALGTGATSLWLESAVRVSKARKWAAWINSDAQLCPHSLFHRRAHLDRILVIEAPEDDKKLLWLLQELMSCSLFELIGCDLGERGLKDHQLRKLQQQARSFQPALVFFSSSGAERMSRNPIFSLSVRLEKRQMNVIRALHRPTPQVFTRRLSYDCFTLHLRDSLVSGFDLGRLTRPQPDPVPAAAAASDGASRAAQPDGGGGGLPAVHAAGPIP